MSLNLTPIENAFDLPMYKIPKIQFDIVTSFQENLVNYPTANSILNNNNNNVNVKKRYLGVIIINPNASTELSESSKEHYEFNRNVKTLSGFSYNIYDNDGEEIMSGNVTNTNLNTITFPISDLRKDYFINVDVEFTIKKHESMSHLTVDKNGSFTIEVDCGKQPQNNPNVLTIEKSPLISYEKEKLFKIFYTRKIMEERKNKKAKEKKSKESNNSNTRCKSYYDLIDERENDVKKFKESNNEFRKRQKEFKESGKIPEFQPVKPKFLRGDDNDDDNDNSRMCTFKIYPPRSFTKPRNDITENRRTFETKQDDELILYNHSTDRENTIKTLDELINELEDN